MNSFALLQALVFEPKKAFAALAERPRFLFPLLLLLVVTVGITVWYYRVVDIEWMTYQQMRNSGFAKALTDAQITAQAKQAAEHPGRGAVFAAIAVVFYVVIVRLLEALYYLLAGKLTNVQRSYKQWLSLACWSSLPSVLSVIPTAIVLYTTTTTQIDQGALQPLSLNSLLFQRAPGEPGYTLLASINLFQLLGLLLAALGVRLWSGRSWLFSVVFTVLPWALIFGIWAWFAMGRS
ncbi:MAG: YIP1 family protein [Steroidobacteraceae bacterium]